LPVLNTCSPVRMATGLADSRFGVEMREPVTTMAGALAESSASAAAWSCA